MRNVVSSSPAPHFWDLGNGLLIGSEIIGHNGATSITRSLGCFNSTSLGFRLSELTFVDLLTTPMLTSASDGWNWVHSIPSVGITMGRTTLYDSHVSVNVFCSNSHTLLVLRRGCTSVSPSGGQEYRILSHLSSACGIRPFSDFK